jgi:hypothetical protein
MKVVRHDGSDERHAVCALVHSPTVLAAVSAAWDRESFASKYANILASWCVDHYTKYKDAPGIGGITARFDTWKDIADATLVGTMADWLATLPATSDMSDDYAVDMIRGIVQRNSLKRLGNALVNLAENGKIEDALNIQNQWKRPKIGQEESGVFPLEDPSVIARAFQHTTKEPLIKYTGALGEFFGDVLSSDSFVSLLAPEKTGKTTVLMDFVWRSVEQGRRTAFFSCGDMSQDQVIVRLLPRLCKRPLKGGRFMIPTELTYENKEPKIVREPKSAPPITLEDATKAFAATAGADPKRFRLLTHPAGTITAKDISNQVSRWADEGWVPEVIVIDYADILGAPPGFKEKREQIDETWRELRALSTRMRCLVLTASQSDTEGYSAWLLTKKNFSDSKTKVAHVTAMIGLNMTESERRQNICRYNYVALREAEFMQDKPAYVAVAGCTKVGRPSLISCWPNE